jgi:RimJ/RimL family protein N-acetyltransferase
MDGYSYCLFPVTIEDASFIVETRLEDCERNKYINETSPDVKTQEKWIESYFNIPDDYYFVIKNKFTNLKEGLVGINNVKDNKAEWGRWIIKKDSVASVESFYLVCRVAFELLCLDEIYSKTIIENYTVVAFHDSINAKRRRVIHKYATIDNKEYDAIEHFITREHFFTIIKPKLSRLLSTMYKRNCIKLQQKDFRNEFIQQYKIHHIGYAVKNIEKSFSVFSLLNYKVESSIVEDFERNIKILFIYNYETRIELIQILDENKESPIDFLFKKDFSFPGNGIPYHICYSVDNIDIAIENLNKIERFIIIQPKSKAPALEEKNVAFLFQHDIGIIELLEG